MSQGDLTALIRAAAQSKYWREQDARLLLTAWAESGRSLASFAREWGISRTRLKRWQERLSGEQQAATPAQLFHRVHVLVEDEEQGGGELELVLRNGRRIIVRGSFDEATFERLLRIAESGPC